MCSWTDVGPKFAPETPSPMFASVRAAGSGCAADLTWDGQGARGGGSGEPWIGTGAHVRVPVTGTASAAGRTFTFSDPQVHGSQDGTVGAGVYVIANEAS